MGIEKCPFCSSNKVVESVSACDVAYQCPDCGAVVTFKNDTLDALAKVDDKSGCKFVARACWNRRD